MSKKSLHSLDISISGLGQKIVFGATGELSDNDTILTCQGGTVVDGQYPPEENGTYDISNGASYSAVTCIATTTEPASWTFSIGNSGE